MGDELIFTYHPNNGKEAVSVVAAFYDTLLQTDKSYQSKKLRLKGSAWIASFPHPNALIPTPTPLKVDYIGPQIDIGFRIGKFAQPGRLVVSIELAELIREVNENTVNGGPKVHFHLSHVGWTRLKGVYSENPYPILWGYTDLNAALNVLKAPWTTFFSEPDHKFEEHLQDPQRHRYTKKLFDSYTNTLSSFSITKSVFDEKKLPTGPHEELTKSREVLKHFPVIGTNKPPQIISSESPGTVLCFGEILWDCLPRGLFPGGAPVNVAYHLKRHGLQAYPVTAIGDDFLGKELLRRCQMWGLPTDFIATVDAPTGVVLAELDAAGNATYDILKDVAWDKIHASQETLAAAKDAKAIVYGTLALRDSANQDSLKSLLSEAPNAFKIYDVNLRPPYDDETLIEELWQHAHLVKLNDDEAAKLGGFLPVEPESNARALWDKISAKNSSLTALCITCGARGAGLFKDDQWFWAKGRRVDVADTIGAGDSFMASLIVPLLNNFNNCLPQRAIENAARLGEYVATQDGAMAEY